MHACMKYKGSPLQRKRKSHEHIVEYFSASSCPCEGTELGIYYLGLCLLIIILFSLHLFHIGLEENGLHTIKGITHHS